jgi:hypothetical protein
MFKYNSTFCPHNLFMCFVWISQQTAIISLYNINWLVFVTETQCVYCAVPFDIIRLILVFKQVLLHLFLPMSQLSPFAAEWSVPREGYRSGKRCQGDDSHVLTDSNWVATSCGGPRVDITLHSDTTFVVLLSWPTSGPQRKPLRLLPNPLRFTVH